MYQRTKSETVLISPQRCEQFLKLNTFEGQRPLSADTVQDYAQQMSAGAFGRANVGVAKKSFNGGEQVIVNGQHTLTAAVKAGVALFATIDYFDCQARDDLWRLFGTYDVHRQRTEGHIIKAARGLFKSQFLQKTPIQVLRLTGAALVALGGGTKPNFGTRAASKVKKPELVQKHEADVMVVASYYEKATARLLTTPVVAAIIATHRVNSDKAADFWERVVWGDKLDRKTPQYELRQKLLNPASMYSSSVTSGPAKMQVVYNYCASWWNSYVTGQERKSVKAGAINGVVALEGKDQA